MKRIHGIASNPRVKWSGSEPELRDDAWPNRPLLGFDLETTGVDPYDCRMVDMALVLDKGDDSDPIVWQWLINPECEIPLTATAIHGINTDNARTNGVTANIACEQIRTVLDEIGSTPPVCIYNAAYDTPILLRESNLAIGHNWLILDAMVLDKMADAYRPGKRTLTAVNAAYGLGVKNAHRAAGDCISAIQVTRAIGRKYPEIGNADLRKLQAIQAEAYREQANQFTEYRQTCGEPEFECSLEWPYNAEMLGQMPNVAKPVCQYSDCGCNGFTGCLNSAYRYCALRE